MPDNKKKRKKKKINFRPILYLLVILTPVLSYIIQVLNITQMPMLDTDGYNYIWFWNVLSSGKILPMQTTVPKPLMVFVYGLLATSGLHFIELVKFLAMIATGYGVFKLSYFITEDYITSYITELLLFILPMTVQNMGFGNSTFLVIPFIVWALYLYNEEHYAISSTLLLLGGLIRPDAWGIAILLPIYHYFSEKKFKPSFLIGFLAPFLWILFDFFLTKDPFYSYKVMHYYMIISGFPVLKSSMLLAKWKEAFIHFGTVYISILLLLSLLFSFIKRKKEVLIISFSAIVLMLQLSISVIRGGLFMDRFAYVVGTLLIIITPFFIKSLFSFTYNWVTPLLFLIISLFTFQKTRTYIKNTVNIFSTEKIKQETCRQMAPQVSVIDDKRVLMPARRIGMFAFLNGKAYTTNITTEREFIARGKTFKDLDYIVFIVADFVGKASYVFAPLYKQDIIKQDNMVIQRLYTTPNGYGKIFKIFVLKESQEGQKNQE